MTTRKKKPALKPESPDSPSPGVSGVEGESKKNAAEVDSQEAAKAHFPIVGIGASAGGLAAFEAFFSGMPADKNPDMAFVLVQHLAPDHKSILTDLIRRCTRMEVSEVEDGVVVQPNCAYIIPPNRDMAFLNGTLQLLEPSSPRGQRLPIDFFFRSLAQDQHERAICIVLSGTGSDGTQGVRAVKGEGGMAMVQNLESTEYDGMPRNAIATGLVDYILPPAEMAAHLIAYATHENAGRLALPLTKADDALKKIFILLRSQTGHDFSQYKHNTTKRRIERRLAVHQLADPGEYVRFLQKTPGEVELLFRDLLIGVTSFFRDPAAFAELEAKAIPRLFADKPAGATIRVWICGCSTGEEAYSIAILLLEQMDKMQKHYMLQIFATDIDSRAIDQARSGLYPASIAADISPERLTRFFTMEADGSAYCINKGIRDLLVFSEQDVIRDPPFSKLDLISCRNLLIYLNSDLQKRLIPLFHYALNPGGSLFLGTSETIGEFVHLYTVLDRHAKLYQRKEDPSNIYRPPLRRFTPAITSEGIDQKRLGPPSGGGKVSLRETTERILLERYAPVSVLVSDQGEMLYIHGNTGRYLQLATGDPNMNILKMAREGLKHNLTIALHSVVKNKKPVERFGLRVKTNGDFSSVNLTVLPVPATPGSITGLNLYLVILEEIQVIEHVLPAPAIETTPPTETDQKTEAGDEFYGLTAGELVSALQHELQAKEEYLKSLNEELETSNEELKSSNEEMQAINEELQSTNEELETSKEELQSINEELFTVNTELQTKVVDLSRLNNDMNNLLSGTGIGTIFVDFNLIIQRFTPPVTQIINLILSDVGRSVGHIVSNLAGYDTLVEDINSVLNSLIPKEVEVQTKEGAWFLMRIRPYRTIQNVIEGAVITFFDINEIKLAREELRKANDILRLAVVIRDAHDAILMQDMEGRILAWNPAAERLYGWSEAEAIKMNISELTPEGLREEALERVRQLSQSDVLETFRTQRTSKDGTVVEVWLTATALLDRDGKVYAISTTERVSGIE
ncbi:MAG: PAS domain-containing protein [Desulfuromonadales bacterium]|nr:PAS domain-containing protein [Desulfuromonadales bacterium]